MHTRLVWRVSVNLIGVNTDINGQARSFDTGFDIGYDEAVVYPVYLPLVVR